MASSGAEVGGGALSGEQATAGSRDNMSGDAEAVQLKPAATAEKEHQQQQEEGITTAPGGASGSGRSSGPAALSQSARVVSTGSNPPTPSKLPQQEVTAANDTRTGDETGEEQPKQVFQKPQQLYSPHDNDVLCGRGGGTNHHPGNKQYRKLVEDRKRDYVNSSKRGKPLLSRSIVEAVRKQDPPGRFLTKDDKTGLWYDIGDQKAREKTAQALREGAPDIRKEIGQPFVHALNPGESLKRILTERDLPHAETTVGHHSPPEMGGGDNNDDGNDDGSSDPSKTLALMKTDTAGKLKRPKSLGSGGGGKRVVSAPVVMGQTAGSLGGSGGGMLSPLAHTSTQTAYYGNSSRGGKRSTSVPHQMQQAGYQYGHQYHGYPPHAYHHQHAQHYYLHQQQQYPQQQKQPFPATAAAAQWVAGGTGTAPTGTPPTSLGPGNASAGGVVTATASTVSGLALSDDVERRLLLSEWITGGKIDEQQLELQRKMEAEADAYRTAGLMGIDPDDITKRLEGGKEDIVSIVESHRAKAMDAATKRAAAGGGPFHFKKRKLNGVGTGNEKSEARKRIDETLSSMGAF